MGLDDLIAEDESTFIDLALKLANDVDFKSQMEAGIRANSHKLYERIEVVREMETFFIEAHKTWQNGLILSNEEFRAILD